MKAGINWHKSESFINTENKEMYLPHVWHMFLVLKKYNHRSKLPGLYWSWLGACMAVWVININNNKNSEIRTVTVLE